MRFLRVLLCDIRYQFRYGFYFIYAVVSAAYIVILPALPAGIRREGAALIIWSDPTVLGFFFIGGIVLLEKGEGLHSYNSILPVTGKEYILAKALSLSVISTLAGLAIAFFGLNGQADHLLLLFGLLTGSALFTLLGLAVGCAARSVNHYLVLGVPAGILLMAPALLTAFKLSHPLLEMLPATLLFRLFFCAVGKAIPYNPWYAAGGLLLWLLPAFALARWRFDLYMQQTGG